MVAKDNLALTLTNKSVLDMFFRRRLANTSRPQVRTLDGRFALDTGVMQFLNTEAFFRQCYK